MGTVARQVHGTTCEGGRVGGVMLAAGTEVGQGLARGSKREAWFAPCGLGGRVPVKVPESAVGGLAGDAERVADLRPARFPVQRPGDGGLEVGFGGS